MVPLHAIKPQRTVSLSYFLVQFAVVNGVCALFLSVKRVYETRLRMPHSQEQGAETLVYMRLYKD